MWYDAFASEKTWIVFTYVVFFIMGLSMLLHYYWALCRESKLS